TTGAGPEPRPPITPPGTPVPLPMPLIPATPAIVGAASSFTILMSLGIFVGACRPWSISDTILIGLTVCLGGGRAGGGAEGGVGVGVEVAPQASRSTPYAAGPRDKATG